MAPNDDWREYRKLVYKMLEDLAADFENLERNKALALKEERVTDLKHLKELMTQLDKESDLTRV